MAITYRDSHSQRGKGTSYDDDFASSSRLKYLWNVEQKVLDGIIKEYFPNQSINLLDFACGTGRIAGFLEDCVETSTGIDISKTMLDEAGKKVKRTELIHADLTRDNILKGRKFNLITAFRFFLNAEPELRISALRVLSDLLTDDGYIVFNNHCNKTNPLNWARQFYYNNILKDYNSNFMSVCEVKKLIKNCDLSLVRIYPVGSFSFPKLGFSNRLNLIMDFFTSRLRCLNIFSESPVIVCKKRLRT